MTPTSHCDSSLRCPVTRESKANISTDRNDDDIETDARADRLYESDHDATEDGDEENAVDAAEVTDVEADNDGDGYGDEHNNDDDGDERDGDDGDDHVSFSLERCL